VNKFSVEARCDCNIATGGNFHSRLLLRITRVRDALKKESMPSPFEGPKPRPFYTNYGSYVNS